MGTRRFTDEDIQLDSLYGDLADLDLQPLWRLSGTLTNEPVPRAQPYRWRARHLREAGERAGRLVPIDRGGDRRVLSCANPGLGGAPHATPTLWAGLQYLGGHEYAPAHRHTPAALRFVFEGSGVWTLVDGDPIHMSRGDLVLTPSWTFHEHHNTTADPMMWLDVLDVPVVSYLESIFYEDGPSDGVDRRTAVESAAERQWSAGSGLTPVARDLPGPPGDYSPLLVYRWSSTDEALRALAGSVERDVRLRFTDPARGTDVMPTMRCEMQRVPAGRTTAPHRQTGSRVGAVLNGTGTLVIAGQEFDIEPGDVFAVPSWSWLTLGSGTGGDLDVFTVSDAPVLEAIRLYREEWAEGQR